jgi:hypothetical protein
MKVLLLYRPNTERARMVEDYVHEFERRDSSRRIDLIDIDSREGSNLASLYDVWDQPAILVIGDDGRSLQMWVGPEMPLMDEVAAYLAAGGGMLVAPQV